MKDVKEKGRISWDRWRETESLRLRVMEEGGREVVWSRSSEQNRTSHKRPHEWPNPSLTSEAPMINGRVSHLTIPVTSKSLWTAHQRPAHWAALTVCTRDKDCWAHRLHRRTFVLLVLDQVTFWGALNSPQTNLVLKEWLLLAISLLKEWLHHIPW